MSHKPTKEDFARVRAVIQRAMEGGLSFDEATVQAEREEPEAFERIVEAPEAEKDA